MAARTFAVVWAYESSGPVYAGSLQLQPEGMTLEGGSAAPGEVQEEIAYREIERVEAIPGNRQRFVGRPAVRIVRRKGPSLQLASAIGAGFLYELVDTLLHALM